MIIRHANMGDLDRLAYIEATCFPTAEAASKESLAARLGAFPECFWLGCADDDVVSFVNGMATDLPALTDEMYADASMHDPRGEWLMIFGVDTLPGYRGRGLASEVLRRAIAETRALGRKGLVLTCKPALGGWYARFGFVDEGLSDSTHGDAVWHQMRQIGRAHV